MSIGAKLKEDRDVARNQKFKTEAESKGFMFISFRRTAVRGRYWVKCNCVCGKEFEVRADRMVTGHTQSCGCRQDAISANAINLTGRRFGKLLVIGRDEATHKYKGRWWDCHCDCGGKHSLQTTTLTSGAVNSCGCIRRVKGAAHSSWTGYEGISGKQWAVTKAQAKTREIDFSITIQQAWELWTQQSGRCAITDVALTLGESASLDRIDSALTYSVDNCQWVHKIVNRMKWDLPMEELYKWTRLIVGHQENYTSSRVQKQRK